MIKSYFIFYTIVIVLKFIGLRAVLFEDYNIWNTLWYELSFVLFLFAIIELVQKKSKIVSYLFIDLLLSALFFGMTIYERYFETMPTFYDLGQLDQVGSVSESIFLLIGPNDFLFFADFLLIAVLFCLRMIWKYPVNHQFASKTIFAVLLVSIGISASNFFFSKHERILDQSLYSYENGVINAQLIKAYEESKAPKEIDFGPEKEDEIFHEIMELKGNEPIPYDQHEFFGVAENRNLILIQIESLQDFVINMELNGQEITPNINEWVKESFYFTDVFQQIGAGNTADAEFIVNTSLYPKGETPVPNVLSRTDKLPGLPRMLRDKGYHTATFHADEVEYWNRTELYPALGFDEYYETAYYGDDDTIGFGPSDGVFYEKTMRKLRDFQASNEPFYAHVLSLTSHTPFEMPADKEYLDLPERYEGTLIGNYLQSVRYADEALGEFFDDLKESGLWDESIIALYGDHSGVHGRLVNSEDVKLLNELLGGRPYSLVDRFNLPFIVGVPGVTEIEGKAIDHIGGQLDMMPTITNLMGVEPNYLYFGHNLLQYEHNLLGMRYYLPTGGLFNDEALFIPKTAKRDVRVYGLREEPLQLEDPKEYFEEDVNNLLKIYDWADPYLDYLIN
ncbi:LTA synthase family protein [Aquibacillus albus]|nr:LTA synthase family protein [Aquibacillus albus]